MKFSFVITNLKGGGAEKAFIKTICILMQAGHECNLFLLDPQIEYSLPPELKFSVIKNLQFNKRGWLGKRILALRLKEKLKEIKPDAIISTLPFADEVTSLTKQPNHWCRIANTLSVEINNLNFISKKKSKKRYLKYQNIYGSRKIIAVSSGVAMDLKDKLKIKSQIELIYNPFDKNDILEKSKEPVNSGMKNEFILYAGRFSKQKRIDLLLDAISEIPAEFDLIMLTPRNPELLKMIENRKLTNRVHVIGFQNNPYNWMHQAKLVVLTSDHEGLPNVLIESLLCGTPVISTDCPSGPREILGDICPEALVPCGDLYSLVNAIKTKLLESKGKINFDLTKFDKKKVLAAYEKIAASME